MIGSRANIHQQIYLFTTAAIAFTLPLFVNINSYLIVILAVNWIAEGQLQQKFRALKKNKWSWLYLGFFLIFLLGIIHSDNTSAALHHVEKKMALLVFPLIFFSTSFSEKIKKWTFTGFLAGCFTATIICLVSAVGIYIEEGATHQFFYHGLSRFIGINAIYLAMYLLFCVIILITFFGKKYKKLTSTGRVLYIALGFYFLILIFLLSSKIVILLLFLFLNILLISFFIIRKKIWRGVILFLLINSVFILILKLTPLQERFGTELRSNMDVLHLEKYNYDTPFTGVTLRITFWKFLIEILNEKKAWLTGVGTGDVKEILNEKYIERNIYTGNPELGDTGYLGYNLHNQYFQLLLGLGIFGMIYFIGILVIPAVKAAQRKYWLYLFFLILFALMCLTESLLETHKGVVFFALFNSLFIKDLFSNNKNAENL